MYLINLNNVIIKYKMSGIWFVNLKKIKNLNNNNFDINHYFLNKDQPEIKQLILNENIESLNRECDVWIKNCKNRWIFNISAVLLSIFLVGLGILFILIDIYLKIHHHDLHALLILGIIFFIVVILIPFFYYFADNWSNPYLYKWAQYLSKFQKYMINTNDLPLSLLLFYYPDLINVNQYDANFHFFLNVKDMKIKESLKKYLISQIEANNASWNYSNKLHNNELNEENAFKYWANIRTIYEWAIFIKKLNQLGKE